jgi:1-acyl-sn-glycerol-3-phosphate acyltransferase
MPLTREYNLFFGMSVASYKAFKYILNNCGVWKEKGQVVMIVPGGAEEALHVNKNEYALVMKKRKGFCKAALQTGSDLVPVFTFGENDIFNTTKPEENSFVWHFQKTFKKITGASLPLAWGRGIFNYNFGILPHRRPMVTVIGKPILVEKSEEPTQKEIDELHEKFLEELTKLFDEHKVNYPQEKEKKIVFL